MRACLVSNNYSRAYIVGDRNYNEEHDPDYKLPEDDKDWLSDLEELEEVEDNLEDEVKCLVEDAAVPVPERYFFSIYRSQLELSLHPGMNLALYLPSRLSSSPSKTHLMRKVLWQTRKRRK